ncbi:MAG: hypothetical protein QXY94_06720, partial [Archaeoglobaceae archaeon]
MNLQELLEKIEEKVTRNVLQKEVFSAEVLARKGDTAIILSSGLIQPGSSVAWVDDVVTPFGFVLDVRKVKHGFLLAVKE